MGLSRRRARGGYPCGRTAPRSGRRPRRSALHRDGAGHRLSLRGRSGEHVMRRRWRPLLIALIVAAPAALGVTASAILSRALRPEEIPSLYLQADMVAIPWISGVLLSLGLAAILVLHIRQER